MAISAVILTKNEERILEKCLRSVSWCDEVIVIDDNSDDKTVKIAKENHANVIARNLDNNFSSQRNFGLEKAKGDWIFFVDADEIVSEKLKNEILVCVQTDKINGFYLKRDDIMWGKKLMHGEQGNGKFLRLAKKNAGKWQGSVHEMWQVVGKKADLQNPLLHYPHPTVRDFLREINFYSTIRAEELYKEGKRASWFSVLVYEKGKFAQDYFLKLGFLDGIEGFIVAIFMSFYSFLVRGKLWQKTSN